MLCATCQRKGSVVKGETNARSHFWHERARLEDALNWGEHLYLFTEEAILLRNHREKLRSFLGGFWIVPTLATRQGSGDMPLLSGAGSLRN